jgi:hypothetical protein
MELLVGLDDVLVEALEPHVVVPVDDEPTTPEEDEGARDAREQLARSEAVSAEDIKREIA